MTDQQAPFEAWLAHFELQLDRSLNECDATPERLEAAMQYAVLGNGKRIRPLLVYASSLALNVDFRDMDAVACAIEIIHAYSLIHDDLPAMDDDDLRRGRPTCHRTFDESTAILAGDALQAFAFQLLAHDKILARRPRNQVQIIGAIARACGASGMAGGQVIDLAAVGTAISPDELRHMHRLKTGALIQVCATAPALFASVDADLLERLSAYGAAIGLAFQIHDDILDVTGTAELTGKTTQKDAVLEKPTFPGLMGIEASRREAQHWRDEAIACLAGFPGDCSALATLAAVAVDRDS
ncbi:MAG: polyprenyl synthetase family protein [Xanthomonadales bacterium]|nr:polyprenyl synthetase family protein [Xanthomonadales bacterium]